MPSCRGVQQFRYLERLDRAEDAFDACVRALEVAPHDGEAVALLARLVERPETRGRAATVLEAEYGEIGDSRREAQAIRVRLEGVCRMQVSGISKAPIGASHRNLVAM